MYSKWVMELLDIYADGGYWDDFLPVLCRIDYLLRRASGEIEDENLYERIIEEIRKVE